LADRGAQNIDRKPRADAARNRARLMDAAKTVFGAKGSAASLDEIARTAGVGIGTLYRHFPTRDALIEAVYRNETEQLAEAATRLMRSHPPVEALREWLLAFVEYIATKRGVAEALDTIVGDTRDLQARSGVLLKEAGEALFRRAVDSGEIRPDLEPMDLVRAVAGVAYVGPEPNWQPAARRVIDVLIAGARTTGK
jgi:AcrR family transcriptional regulator